MPFNPFQIRFNFRIPQRNRATQNPVAQPAREEQQSRSEDAGSTAASSHHTMAARALHLQRALTDAANAGESSRRNHHLEFYVFSLDSWVKKSSSNQKRFREEVRNRIVGWLDAGREEAPLNLSAASLREAVGIDEALTQMPPLPPGVQMADISGHRFLNLPERNLPNTLRFLNASECNLHYLDITLPASLEVLNIQNNRIENLPPRLPNSLVRLNASEGQGELIVPSSILAAASRTENPCEINLRGTRISAASQRRIETHNQRVSQNGIGRQIEIERGASSRSNNINIYGVGRRSETLGQAVQAWYTTDVPGRTAAWQNIRREAISQANAISLEDLNQANEEMLNRAHQDDRFTDDPTVHFWALLDSLKGTKDARIDSTFRERVTVLLDAMKGDKELRDTCFSIARAGDETCHDNVTLRFNQMEQAHLIRRAEKGDFTPQEIFNLGVNTFKLQVLDEQAIKKAHEIGKDHEALEVVLYYRTNLADRLNLPHQSRNMIFNTVATYDQNWNVAVNRRVLDKAAETVQSVANNPKPIVEFMVGWKPWLKDLARRYPEKFNPAELEKAQEKIYDQLEKLDKRNDLNEGDKLERSKALLEEFNKLDGKLFGPERERLTKEFVMSNAASSSQS